MGELTTLHRSLSEQATGCGYTHCLASKEVASLVAHGSSAVSLGGLHASPGLEHLQQRVFLCTCCCPLLLLSRAPAVPTDCPPGVCYNATSREKLWGFATSIGPLDDLRAGNDTRLDLLKHKNYKWL